MEFVLGSWVYTGTVSPLLNFIFSMKNFLCPQSIGQGGKREINLCTPSHSSYETLSFCPPSRQWQPCKLQSLPSIDSSCRVTANSQVLCNGKKTSYLLQSALLTFQQIYQGKQSNDEAWTFVRYENIGQPSQEPRYHATCMQYSIFNRFFLVSCFSNYAPCITGRV